MAAVKIGASRQIVIPKKLYDKLGLASGEYLEVQLDGNKLVLTPHQLIEKRLVEGMEDIRERRVRGPYNDVGEAMNTLHSDPS